MKIFATFSLLLGIIFAFIGILPFIFPYPFSNGPHSGPSNVWELILMISHDGKGWYLIIGIALFLLPLLKKYLSFKMRIIYIFLK